eukprot:273927-Chlamydomonas_euryale.AAC.1
MPLGASPAAAAAAAAAPPALLLAPNSTRMCLRTMGSCSSACVDGRSPGSARSRQLTSAWKGRLKKVGRG